MVGDDADTLAAPSEHGTKVRAFLTLADDGTDWRVAAEAYFTDGSKPSDAWWDWGDGAATRGNPTEHTFAEPGVYNVSIAADHASAGHLTHVVTLRLNLQGVHDSAPVTLTVEPTYPRNGTPAHFSLTSRDGFVEEAAWDLGDGTITTGTSVTHTYAEPGQYTVRVAVEGADWHHDLVDEILILSSEKSPEAAPAANATQSDTSGAAPVAAQAPRDLASDAHPTIRALRAAIAAANGTKHVMVQATRVEPGLTFSGAWGEAANHAVVLQPSNILATDAFSERDGHPIARPFVEVYEGHVANEPNQLVRLTLTDHWGRGSIRADDTVHLIRINMEGNAIPATAAEPAGTVEPRSPEPTGCPGGVEAWAPTSATASPLQTGDRSGLPPLTARIIMDGDAELWRLLGEDAYGTMVAMVAEVDAMYDYEVGIRLQVTGLHVNTDPAYYPDPEVADPHQQAGRYWDEYHRDERDIVHVVTGHDSDHASANCIGAAGHTAGYTFTPYPWELRYVVFHTNAFAHELGHIFAAHHHYGNHAETELATVMIQGYTPGIDPGFSALSKHVIRGWAESNLAG